MVDVAALTDLNAQRWHDAKPQRNFLSVAQHLVKPEAKFQYLAVSARTGVPWPIIAVIHERESSQDWTRSLAQGDPWNRTSTHVPIGRGPFASWQDAAVDALVNCSPYLGKHNDWSIGGALTALEGFNGFGYAARGVPSPYLWAGTNQYRSGKFIRDGVYNADFVDQQYGCAGLLLGMMELDKSIQLSAAGTIEAPHPVPPAPAPSPQRSLIDIIISFIASLFRSKP